MQLVDKPNEQISINNRLPSHIPCSLLSFPMGIPGNRPAVAMLINSNSRWTPGIPVRNGSKDTPTVRKRLPGDEVIAVAGSDFLSYHDRNAYQVRALPYQQLRLIVVQQADRGQSLTSQACPALHRISQLTGAAVSVNIIGYQGWWH